MASRVAAVYLVLLFISWVGVSAHTEPVPPSDNVNLEFRDIPIKTVLDTLFKAVNRSYVLEPGIVEPVNVLIKDVPFETAIRTILKAHGLTCTVDGGVYLIQRQHPQIAVQEMPPEEEIPTPVQETTVYEKITLNNVDVRDVAEILGFQLPSQTPGQPNTFTPGGWGNLTVYPSPGWWGMGYSNWGYPTLGGQYPNYRYGYGYPQYGNQQFRTRNQGGGYGNPIQR